MTMTWREIDDALRAGGELHTSPVGAWMVINGRELNVRHASVKSVFSRDLVVVARKLGPNHYVYRSKYGRGANE